MKKDPNSLFVPTYARSGSPMVKGKGVYLWDADGRRYLDFGSGIAVSALGHSHPAVVKTLREQGGRLLHSSNLYFCDTQISLAERLLKVSFGDRIFFCNSGTEANEAAIKFARKWARAISPEKYNVLSFTDGFHGRTYGALSATAQPKFHQGFEPLAGGFRYAEFNDIEATRKVLDSMEFAAIMVEPLQGEGGVNGATPEFLRFLRDYADRHRIVLVFDEIQCGMGRTGTLWHYEKFGIVPDLMTLAKPLGGGVPLGAVVCREQVAMAIAPGDHGTTFGGNPLACAIGCTVLDVISKKPFLRQVSSNGAYLRKKLESVRREYPQVVGVRGEGLLVGVGMKSDPAPLVKECKERGLLLIKAGHNTIRFIPPLIVTREEIDKAVAIFAAVLEQQAPVAAV